MSVFVNVHGFQVLQVVSEGTDQKTKKYLCGNSVNLTNGVISFTTWADLDFLKQWKISTVC